MSPANGPSLYPIPSIGVHTVEAYLSCVEVGNLYFKVNADHSIRNKILMSVIELEISIFHKEIEISAFKTEVSVFQLQISIY